MKKSWMNVPKAKMYQIKARGHSKIKEVNIAGRKMKFFNKIFHTADHRLAQDIQDKYPHDVMAIPHDSWRDDPAGTHRYSWGLSHMGNWKDRIDWGE